MNFRHWLAAAAVAASPFAATPALAQGEVVVYCSVQEEWCRPMVAAFEKATGIKVLMTRKSSGETYAQIKAESSNPKGDIWWGGTGDPHLQAAEELLTGLCVARPAHDSCRTGPCARRWRPRCAPSASIRALWVMATTPRNCQEAGLPEPKCWKDLVKPVYKGKIQVANPNSSGTSYTMLATLVQLFGEDEAFDYMKALTRQRQPVHQVRLSADQGRRRRRDRHRHRVRARRGGRWPKPVFRSRSSFPAKAPATRSAP
jgi:iron(III) transport system substrate-binding protein